MNKSIYKNVSELKCSGCGVCSAICPTDAIKIKIDDKGFYGAEVVEDKCINCGLCTKICPFNVETKFTEPIDTYSAVRKSCDNSIKSSSAGICWDVAKKAIEKGYKACGAKYNTENNKVEHFTASNIQEYLPAQGSKYLQSYSVDAFKEILMDKSDQKFIVFGTPCQISGLRNYVKLKKMEEKFIFIDFFCHGVPSYHLWESYLAYQGISNIKEVIFRDNSREKWNDFCMNIASEDKKVNSSSKENDLFYRFFILDFCLSEVCCESCPFFASNSSADIRFGDVWNRTLHNINDPMSLALVYNDKAKWLLEEVSDTQIFAKQDINELIKGQPMYFRKTYRFTNLIIKSLKRRVNLKLLYYIFVFPKLVVGFIKKKVRM